MKKKYCEISAKNFSLFYLYVSFLFVLLGFGFTCSHCFYHFSSHQVLTGDNLDQLDKLYQAISPSRDENGTDYAERLNTAAEHLVNILEGKDRNVLGTTYKEIKELLNLINECGYFERAHEGKVEEGD